MVQQGAAFWPLQLARELDDAILDIRLNELEVATIVFKSDGDAQRVLAYDALLDANATHWLAREIRFKWRRVLKRVDMTSRSLVTLIEPGSCFAGTLAELTFAADRSYMLIGTMQGDNRAPAAIVLGDANFSGVYAMSNGLSRLATRFLGEPDSLDAAKAEIGKPLDAEQVGRARPRHLRARRHRLGRRSPPLPRGARELLARRADRHGSEPALRGPRDDGNEDLRAVDRLAELDLPAPERGRSRRRAHALRVGAEAEFRFEEGVSMTMQDINVDYSTTIPNNVGLGEDRRVLKALEVWHPGYLNWWNDMGPEGFQEKLVYLRTAYSVDPRGWAKFDYVRMPEYRWGVLLAPQEENRKIPFGQHYGEPAWQEVPGEYRAMLRRLVVIQGDTEPASVEQQRHLGKTAPSLYDMRNLFQVNVEEGRHLWAMVYLLQKYFGRDGREEADELLRRRSGSADAPRMLGAFNEATPDWLSFFMFTYFTDRDGKMQLHSLAQSGFDPLSRTCRFMLTEEAHHMFVGETGISRVVQRTCEAMKEAGITDPTDIAKVRALGVIDLPTIQKKLNLHYTLSLDLFGSEVSTNAANAFNAGIKGRYRETQIEDDHQLKNDTYPVLKLVNGEAKRVDEPALTALNMRLRDDYTQDCVKGMLRWNKIISTAGYDYKLTLPNVAFHRQIGEFKDVHATPDGVLIDDATWAKRKNEWLPSTEDGDFIASLMTPVSEPANFASGSRRPRSASTTNPATSST